VTDEERRHWVRRGVGGARKAPIAAGLAVLVAAIVVLVASASGTMNASSLTVSYLDFDQSHTALLTKLLIAAAAAAAAILTAATLAERTPGRARLALIDVAQVGSIAVLGGVLAIASGAMDSCNLTLVFMGFDQDRAQLITSLLISSAAAGAATLAIGKPRLATLFGLCVFGALFGHVFAVESDNAMRSTGVDGSFDLAGWFSTLVTLATVGVISSGAGAALVQAIRPSLVSASVAAVEAVRSRRADRRVVRPLAVVGVLVLLAFTVPIFGDMVNYTPDSRMLRGGAPPVGLIPDGPTESPGASPLGVVPGSATLSSKRPWLSWRPSGSGSVTAAQLPAPWANGATTPDVNVYTPPGYQANGSRHYPVLYEAPTGFAFWDSATNVKIALDTLIDRGVVPPMIVVFVGSGAGPYPDSECADSYDGKEQEATDFVNLLATQGYSYVAIQDKVGHGWNRQAVTGSEGFIGPRRSHLVEALVGSRGAKARPGDGPLQLVQLVGLAGVAAARRARVRGGPARGRPRHRVRHGAGRGRGHRLPPGRADRDPLLLSVAAFVRGHQRVRHAQRHGGGPAAADAARRPYLHERGLRHGSQRPDQRGSPAAGPVAVLRLQDRRRQDRRELPPLVRGPGRDAAAVQHLRPAPVEPRGDPHDPVAAGSRAAPDPPGRPAADTRLHVRDGHGPSLRGPRRGAGRGRARRDLQCRHRRRDSIGSARRQIAKAAGHEVEVIEEAERLRPSGSEVMRLLCDSSRLSAATGWKAEVGPGRGPDQRRPSGSPSRRTWPATSGANTRYDPMSAERHAVILAGGKGTRLRPYTTSIPKPLVPIGDDCAILEIVLRQLAAHGFGG
jgi:hypothetical protein